MNTPVATPNHDSVTDTAIEAALLDSPSHITVPRWVALSGVSLAARALAQELIDGTMRVHGDQAPTLDRPYLAWVLGSSRPDKVLPEAIRELVNIEFLAIYSGGTAADGTQQQRRDSRTGQHIPDTYGLRLDPPDSYPGPRNRAEAHELFRRDYDDAQQRHRHNNNRSRAVANPRRSFERAGAFPQVVPVPPARGTDAESVPPKRGTPRKTPGQSRTPAEGYGRTPGEGYGDVFAGKACTPRQGYLSKEGRELPSGSSLPLINQGTAAPPAQGGADGEPPSGSDEALRIVSRLPWPSGKRPTRTDANRLAAAIDQAADRAGLTYVELHEHLTARAHRAHRITYLLNALADDKLPLPGLNEQDDRQPGDDQAGPVDPAPTSLQPVPARMHLPACGTCGAFDGEGMAVRMATNPDTGRAGKCPDCHPYANAAA